MGEDCLTILINGIKYLGSIADGPGVRTVLFVQGCNRGCDDCHNPSTWDIESGTKVNVADLVKELNEKCINNKLTISGGEPLLQYPAILQLVKSLTNFNIVLYTGFEFEDVPLEILKYIDYIKVGSFIKEKKTTTTPYIGSKNQKFVSLKGKDKKNEIN